MCLFFIRDLALYRTKYADVYEFTASALISLPPKKWASLNATAPFFHVCKANISSYEVTYLVGDDVHENPKATKERLVDPYLGVPL